MVSENTMEKCKRWFMTFHRTKHHESLFEPLCHFPRMSFLMLTIFSLLSSPGLTLYSFSSRSDSSILLLVDSPVPPQRRDPIHFLLVVSHSLLDSTVKETALGTALSKRRGGGRTSFLSEKQAKYGITYQ